MDTITAAMGECLVGHFVGQFPGWPMIKVMAKRWKVRHEIQVSKTMWFLSKFQSVVDLTWRSIGPLKALEREGE